MALDFNIAGVAALAVGLAMDAMAVSISGGVASRVFRPRMAFKLAFYFGLFQAIMPIFGWLAGLGLRTLIQHFDHWIAFGLLAGVGGKMLYEAAFSHPEERKLNFDSLSSVLVLAVATSIDAAAVGLSFAFLKISISWAVAIIGFITFLLSLAGFYIGCCCGRHLETKAEFAGGIILIAIGARILYLHLTGMA